MKLKTLTLGLGLVLAAFLWAQRHQAPVQQIQFSAIIDLTHPAGPNTPTYDPADKLEARTTATYAKEGFFMRTICLPEHFGTHLDAPAHFAQGHWTVDQIPPERLIAPLVVIDVSHKAATNPDYLVSMDDVALWERANGHVPPGAVVLARTGWAARWKTADKYRNADAKGAMHFPGWSLDAVRFLVEGRDIFGLGIDTLSVDPGTSKDFPVHKFTAPRNVYHLENVADMGRVPDAGAIALVAPIDLKGGSGGPVRVMALVK